MRSALTIGLFGLAACAPETGIWLLEIDAQGDTSCETTFTHNFVNVVEPETTEDDPNWSDNSSSSESPSLRFVQIEMGSGNNCVMLWGTEVYPGTCDGGSWKFKWELKDSGATNQEHALGYTYSHAFEYLDTTQLTLEVAGASASGTLSENASSQDIYSESDMWAAAVGLTMGQMPVGRYLKKMAQDDEGNPIVENAVNTRAGTECAASECSIESEEICSSEDRTVRANFYAFGEDPNYDNLRNNSQNQGIPAEPGGQGGQQPSP